MKPRVAVRLGWVAVPVLLGLVSAPSAVAVITVFSRDLAGFDAAAGAPPVVVDFDATVPGTDIGGQTLGGVQFLAGNAPLIVVRGVDTVTVAGGFTGIVDADTNKLPATSGENVLSPGGVVLGPGPDAAVEDDDVTMLFSPPVASVGFDHLSQSSDGFGFTSIEVRDQFDTVLYSGPIPISDLGGGGAPGGADFFGVVSDAADIAKIVIDEGDDNAGFPDSNIGIDTVRVGDLALPGPCELLTGKKLLLKSRGDSEKKRGIGLLSRDIALTLGAGNGSADDPVLHGGTLRVVSLAGDGFDDTYALPATRWSYKQKAGQNKGYKFRPTKPFKSVTVQPGKRIKVVAKGEGLGHTLGSDPAPVEVVLTLGSHCYCLRFGGDAAAFKPDKKWLSKAAPAPTGCPSDD